MGLWTNEYGEEIRKGRPITSYFPGIETPFSAIATKRKIRKGLGERKSDYSDENDWAVRDNLDKEIEKYGILDGVIDPLLFRTDEGIVDHYVNKAKRKIGK